MEEPGYLSTHQNFRDRCLNTKTTQNDGEGTALTEPILIKDLQAGMRDACIEGTVVEVTPVENRLSPPKREPRKIASFILHDDSGRVRVVMMGRYCRVLQEEQIMVGRPVKIEYARVRQGQDGNPEIILHRGYAHVEGSPTPEEEAYRERMTYKCFSDSPPVHERLQIVPIAEIRCVFPPSVDWSPDLTLKAEIPPDRLQLHEGKLLELRNIWDDPAKRDSLCLQAVPLVYGREIRGDLVLLTESHGELFVSWEGVYRVKVAREKGLTHILALVRERIDNPH